MRTIALASARDIAHEAVLSERSAQHAIGTAIEPCQRAGNCFVEAIDKPEPCRASTSQAVRPQAAAMRPQRIERRFVSGAKRARQCV